MNDKVKAEMDRIIDELAAAYGYEVTAEFPDRRGTQTITVPGKLGFSGVQFAAALAYAQGARAVRAVVTFPDPNPTKEKLAKLAESMQGEPDAEVQASPELPHNVTPITKAKRRLH